MYYDLTGTLTGFYKDSNMNIGRLEASWYFLRPPGTSWEVLGGPRSRVSGGTLGLPGQEKLPRAPLLEIDHSRVWPCKALQELPVSRTQEPAGAGVPTGEPRLLTPPPVPRLPGFLGSPRSYEVLGRLRKASGSRNFPRKSY